VPGLLDLFIQPVLTSIFFSDLMASGFLGSLTGEYAILEACFDLVGVDALR
jgi:hypothetical protein